MSKEIIIETDDNYWDCECEKNYIHPNTHKNCALCGAVADESPDSRIDEIRAWYGKDDEHGSV